MFAREGMQPAARGFSPAAEAAAVQGLLRECAQLAIFLRGPPPAGFRLLSQVLPALYVTLRSKSNIVNDLQVAQSSAQFGCLTRLGEA